MLLPIILILIVSIGVLSWSSIHSLASSKRQDLLSRNQMIAEQVAFAVHSAFYTLNWDFVERLLDSEIQSAEVLWLSILNPDCEVYIGRGEKMRTECLNKCTDYEQRNKKAGLFFLDQDTFRIKQPIAIGNETWMVSLGGSLKSISHQKKVIIAENLKVGLFVVLLSCLTCYFVSRRITRPIVALVNSAEDIAQGKFGISIPVTSLDEIGKLTETFNRMSTSLLEFSSQNKAYSHNLKEMVATRTQDLQQTTNQLTSILKTSTQGFWQGDNNAITEKINPRLAEILGRKEEDIVGHSITEFLDDENKAILKKARTQRDLGKKGSYEMSLSRPDGSLVPCLINAVPLYNTQNEKIGSIAMASDISWLKEVEIRLRDSKNKAEAANHSKSVFLANMSHDIRTPMNGIIGMTQIALNKEQNPEQQKYLENIKKSADGLLGLLNDILDFSKIEAGQLLIEKHNFSLLTILENAISIMTFAAEEKGLELLFQNDALDMPAFIMGDELRLRQIFVNLIGNSIKFTEKGTVTLKVALENRESDRLGLHFMVIDTGIGIPADRQEAIFSSFSQADTSTTREFGGTGLGLTICKQLIELMGGKIWVESIPGQGTTFHVTIILDQGYEKNIQIEGETGKPQVRKLDILLVDDNEINCDIARCVLEQNEHRIVTAKNGIEALEILVSQTFDLVLMDVQMPIMDGLTASTIIRASENNNDLSNFNLPPSLQKKLIQQCKGRHIPIVAMTANAMVGDKEKCLAAGMDSYLTKPFEPTQVRAVIADIINT